MLRVMVDYQDTICAISTPMGEGGIGIVRLSGDRAIAIAESLFQAASGVKLAECQSHTVHYGKIMDEDVVLDEVLISLFRSPRSYTTEDTVEINTHGGIVVTRKILSVLVKYGARVAEAGEFTKRAFLNGRIDLTQAEAVLDLIKAKTDLSAQTAAQQLEGVLSGKIRVIKDRLVTVLAHIEGFVDFPEDDMELFSDVQFKETFSEIEDVLEKMIRTYVNGAVIREGVHTVLVGKPNVGKSSLLNTLLNRDRAIVSDVAGTTRDALEELIEIDGVPFRLVDTAGIIPTPQHQLDYLSIQKTRQQYQQGDLILFVLDGAQELDDEDWTIYEELKNKNCIVVINKCDLPQCADVSPLLARSNTKVRCVSVSVATKEGIPQLEKALVEFVWQGEYERGNVMIMRVRQKDALHGALQSVHRAHELFMQQEPIELLAYDVHEAVKKLREFIGEVYSDDILNVIFDEFCIGK